MNLGRDVTLDYIVDVRYEEKPADRWHIEIALEGVHTVIPIRVFERMANYVDQVKHDRTSRPAQADARRRGPGSGRTRGRVRRGCHAVPGSARGRPGDGGRTPKILQRLQDRDERRVNPSWPTGDDK